MHPICDCLFILGTQDQRARCSLNGVRGAGTRRSSAGCRRSSRRCSARAWGCSTAARSPRLASPTSSYSPRPTTLWGRSTLSSLPLTRVPPPRLSTFMRPPAVPARARAAGSEVGGAGGGAVLTAHVLAVLVGALAARARALGCKQRLHAAVRGPRRPVAEHGQLAGGWRAAGRRGAWGAHAGGSTAAALKWFKCRAARTHARSTERGEAPWGVGGEGVLIRLATRARAYHTGPWWANLMTLEPSISWSPQRARGFMTARSGHWNESANGLYCASGPGHAGASAEPCIRENSIL
jgi:hypothetical protein